MTRGREDELVEAAEQLDGLLDLHAWGQIDLGPTAQRLLVELIERVEQEAAGVPV